MENPSFEIATALRGSLKNYSAATLRSDVSAGLVVSLIALPLAMALSIAVGLPPEHGIYTAIVAGIVAPLLGGSMTQVSGPTAAFVVIIAPIVATHGLHGLIWCQILAGLFLIMMGCAKLGRYIRLVPYPVVTGFTAGIGIVIATLALNDFFGLGIASLTGDYAHKVATLIAHHASFNRNEFFIGLATLLVIMGFPKITRIIPSPVVGIAFGGALAYAMTHSGIAIDTIGSRFSYHDAGGALHAGIPPYPPSFYLPGGGASAPLPFPDINQLKVYIIPALVIAALAALESLLAATVADHMAGGKHAPNAELNGIGIANILCGLASGIPATGAIARTATAIHNGAKTPVACVAHALFIMVFVLFFSPLINGVPMASLAALLLVMAYRMSHIKQCFQLLKHASTEDRAMLLVTLLLTVFVDMVAGVSAGMALVLIFYLKRRTKGGV